MNNIKGETKIEMENRKQLANESKTQDKNEEGQESMKKKQPEAPKGYWELAPMHMKIGHKKVVTTCQPLIREKHQKEPAEPQLERIVMSRRNSARYAGCTHHMSKRHANIRITARYAKVKAIATETTINTA